MSSKKHGMSARNSIDDFLMTGDSKYTMSMLKGPRRTEAISAIDKSLIDICLAKGGERVGVMSRSLDGIKRKCEDVGLAEGVQFTASDSKIEFLNGSTITLIHKQKK